MLNDTTVLEKALPCMVALNPGAVRAPFFMSSHVEFNYQSTTQKFLEPNLDRLNTPMLLM